VRILLARLAVLSVVALTAVTLAGCGLSPSNTSAPATTTEATATTSATTQPAQQLMALTIYRVEDGVVVPRSVQVPQTEAVAGAALAQLAPGATVSIADGTATVDVANPTADQTAEIVFTLTQFPTVQRVDVGGRAGLERSDLVSYAPIILIDTPAAGATVAETFTVSGSAEVFEASLVVELVREGKVLEKQTVTASAGAPDRGTFSTSLHAPSPGSAAVVAFAPSAEDGSPQHEVEVPVTVTP
jgi:hypothetical protein